ncbi:hypothetical protein M2475_000591 [Breznakia sp. PF5-3]|nr:MULTISPECIES: hypothetical protein [unclassified Breznakia]MDF9824233.1 hypothetical protein [Breznakia sp. PM6-1]MDF9835031.1 hypothetical protein [Breznakia sp. PF5-3]MDF9837276.1 hypothetical protein [Breznakia sp. PFB2-8]MDF9859266.1 hypothetical protein [Breznakia sp. PH5-24]
MNCGYDMMALILFFITVFVCSFYIMKLKRQHAQSNVLHDQFSKYFKKND